MKASVFSIIMMLTMFSFGQDFKAGVIRSANDQKPKCEMSYDKESKNITIVVKDAGDNAGILSISIDGDSSFFDGITEATIVKAVSNPLVLYCVEDIGGNKISGEYKIRKETVYDDYFIVPSFNATYGIKSNIDYRNVSLYYGKKTSTGYHSTIPSYKYKGIMLSYSYTLFDSIYNSDTDIKAGYMFGEANAKMYPEAFGISGYGCEIIPFVKYATKKDKMGIGVISSVYANCYMFGFENKLSAEYIGGSVNYSNKTSVGVLFAWAGAGVGYEFGTLYGKKFNYFKIDCTLVIPFFYGYRPEHKQMEK